MRVREHRESPTTAKEMMIRCSDCGKIGVVKFITQGTPQERQALIRAFTDEHRQIGCPGKPSEEGRKYELWYPRK